MELEKKIQSKRHEELLQALKKVSMSMSEMGKMSDTELVAAVTKQTAVIQSFLDEYKKAESKGMEKEDKNEYAVFELMAKSILSELKLISKALSKEEKKETVEWEHIITKRDYYGRAEIITSKPKK